MKQTVSYDAKDDDPAANDHLKQNVCQYVLYDKTRNGGAGASDHGGTTSSNSFQQISNTGCKPNINKNDGGEGSRNRLLYTSDHSGSRRSMGGNDSETRDNLWSYIIHMHEANTNVDTVFKSRNPRKYI